MHTVEREAIAAETQQGVHEVPCPRCGSTMVETDRIVENGFAYIWYECSAADCTEQWLSKRPAMAG